MSDSEDLAARFELERARITAVAYRMLGSVSEAEDAVQETWVRLASSDARAIRNLPGWVTTAVGRVCLNVLRGRRRRGEVPLETHVPDPIVHESSSDPADSTLQHESVSLALMVVLGSLGPDERIVFVLHDMFAVPFEELSLLVERSAPATRQLASRARRRVENSHAVRSDSLADAPDPALLERTVAAFFAATQAGDLEALVAVLHPDVVLRSDAGTGPSALSTILHGGTVVASQAVMFGRLAPDAVPAWINGEAGAVVVVGGRVRSVMAFSVVGGRVTEINVLADRARLQAVQVPQR
ncbi:sigma factor [Brachybacterium sp. FME24]|uniref:sigma factor n=1 Tax=Brachybacterium sp. FME24 TaxID=2742605 RepID=UPI0018683F73|nr:sigma factor [Brachybacterium sp. FME24]